MASDSRRQTHHRFEASSSARRPSTSHHTTVPVTRCSILTGKSFLLEIDNRQDRDRVSCMIRVCGGEIIHSYDGDINPYVVVSDHSLAIKIEQKKIDVQNPSEKLLKTIPSLLREAIKRKIKIRTVETFMKHMHSSFDKAARTSSATNSTGTYKPRQSTIQHRPVTNRKRKTTPEETRKIRDANKNSMAAPNFLRMDIPGKQPDIRKIERPCSFHYHSGRDAGYSVFRRADPGLIARRSHEYELFLAGQYVASKKSNYKLEDEETFCQFCETTVQRMAEHIKTDAHRNKMRCQGTMPEMERVVMSTRLAMNDQSRREKRKSEEVFRRQIDTVKTARYMYGENEFKIEWGEIWKRINGEEAADHVEPEKEKASENAKSSSSSQPLPTSFPTNSPDIDLLKFCGIAPSYINTSS